MATSGKPEERSEKVDLGFVEECNPRLLKSHYFPSKVGDKPAWLSLKPIPRPEALTCPTCGSPQIFLLQVYAPRDSRDDAFHRTIFVFVCRNPACCVPNSGENFRVYRSQLGRINDFFSSEPPPDNPNAVDESERPDASKLQPLCAVCGCTGPKVCGRCHRQHYCSKEHQTVHWKAGHKKNCSADPAQETTEMEIDCHVLFPEGELTIEAEDMLQEESTGPSHELPQSSQVEASGSSMQYSSEELEQMARQETEDDKHFQKFKKRVAQAPDQVLRYCRTGEPLWVSSENKVAAKDIPNCSCGARREFEFQVMPQLLNYLGVDSTGASLDWGTVCVYTCSNSCSIGNSYVPEYIWKQDFSAQ